MLNVARGLLNNYEDTTDNQRLSTLIFFSVVTLKNIRNFLIELSELRGNGLIDYMGDTWNFIEVTAIIATAIYSIIDFLLVYEKLDSDPYLIGFLQVLLLILFFI
jgi:hypothetical protein